MRDLFIRSLERFLDILVWVVAAFVIISGLVAMFSSNAGFFYGLISGLAIWIFGALNMLMVFGGLYLGLGIYHNTLRAAEAAEKRLPPNL